MCDVCVNTLCVSAAAAAAASGPVGATAAAAAIKWIVKDGIGAAGRLLVGGRLGLEFDDDPRRYRMMGEALTTLGEQGGAWEGGGGSWGGEDKPAWWGEEGEETLAFQATMVEGEGVRGAS